MADQPFGALRPYAVERAADPLHCAWIDTEPLGYLAHALGAKRLALSLGPSGRLHGCTDSRFQLRR